MTSKEIAAIIVEAGIIPPCDEKEAVEKLGSYGFVDDDMANLLEAGRTVLSSLQWEENRSGTTYSGYEELAAAVAKAERRGR